MNQKVSKVAFKRLRVEKTKTGRHQWQGDSNFGLLSYKIVECSDHLWKNTSEKILLRAVFQPKLLNLISQGYMHS